MAPSAFLSREDESEGLIPMEVFLPNEIIDESHGTREELADLIIAHGGSITKVLKAAHLVLVDPTDAPMTERIFSLASAVPMQKGVAFVKPIWLVDSAAQGRFLYPKSDLYMVTRVSRPSASPKRPFSTKDGLVAGEVKPKAPYTENEKNTAVQIILKHGPESLKGKVLSTKLSKAVSSHTATSWQSHLLKHLEDTYLPRIIAALRKSNDATDLERWKELLKANEEARRRSQQALQSDQMKAMARQSSSTGDQRAAREPSAPSYEISASPRSVQEQRVPPVHKDSPPMQDGEKKMIRTEGLPTPPSEPLGSPQELKVEESKREREEMRAAAEEDALRFQAARRAKAAAAPQSSASNVGTQTETAEGGSRPPRESTTLPKRGEQEGENAITVAASPRIDTSVVELLGHYLVAWVCAWDEDKCSSGEEWPNHEPKVGALLRLPPCVYDDIAEEFDMHSSEEWRRIIESDQAPLYAELAWQAFGMLHEAEDSAEEHRDQPAPEHPAYLPVVAHTASARASTEAPARMTLDADQRRINDMPLPTNPRSRAFHASGSIARQVKGDASSNTTPAQGLRARLLSPLPEQSQMGSGSRPSGDRSATSPARAGLGLGTPPLRAHLRRPEPVLMDYATGAGLAARRDSRGPSRPRHSAIETRTLQQRRDVDDYERGEEPLLRQQRRVTAYGGMEQREKRYAPGWESPGSRQMRLERESVQRQQDAYLAAELSDKERRRAAWNARVSAMARRFGLTEKVVLAHMDETGRHAGSLSHAERKICSRLEEMLDRVGGELLEDAIRHLKRAGGSFSEAEISLARAVKRSERIQAVETQDPYHRVEDYYDVEAVEGEQIPSAMDEEGDYVAPRRRELPRSRALRRSTDYRQQQDQYAAAGSTTPLVDMAADSRKRPATEYLAGDRSTPRSRLLNGFHSRQSNASPMRFKG